MDLELELTEIGARFSRETSVTRRKELEDQARAVISAIHDWYITAYEGQIQRYTERIEEHEAKLELWSEDRDKVLADKMSQLLSLDLSPDMLEF